VINSFQAYHWPGNIRELENEVERAVILSPGNQLYLGDWLTKNVKSLGKPSIPDLDELQKEHIIHVLQLTNGKVKGEAGAAKILGLKPSTLISRMKKLGVKVNKKIVEISP
jgi:formate hydrogenlyase transcriptional activator